MDLSSGDEDFVGTLPVLEPPPGFEDFQPGVPCTDFHYYDDPYSEDEDEANWKQNLDSQTVSQYADQLSRTIIGAIFAKPSNRVRMRTKKAPTQAVKIPPKVQEGDLYSVPIDSLTGGSTTKSKLMKAHNRHSIAVPRAAAINPDEPVHMTLDEVRSYLREFQDTSTYSSARKPWLLHSSQSVESSTSDSKRKSCFVWTPHMLSKNSSSFDDARTKRSRKSLSVTAAGIKQALFSVFRLSSNQGQHHHHFSQLHHQDNARHNNICPTGWTFSMPDKSGTLSHSAGNSPNQRRALPPLPPEEPVGFVRVPSRLAPVLPEAPTVDEVHHDIQQLDLSGSSSGLAPPSVNSSPSEKSLERKNKLDFAASIEAVKDHGWYWGPLAGEAAEQILSTEPDGSFLVRDSSDDHYIFSLSFKLNGGVRHVRIEHDHGNFSFGSVARFKSQTMVEFIDKAIEHSRSGRFLFFLHRRPTHGPTRVQLLHPVSRFRQVQSLQHLSRFVILKYVRRDQIALLPLPKRLRDYLNTAHYYSEQTLGTTTKNHSSQ